MIQVSVKEYQTLYRTGLKGYTARISGVKACRWCLLFFLIAPTLCLSQNSEPHSLILTRLPASGLRTSFEIVRYGLDGSAHLDLRKEERVLSEGLGPNLSEIPSPNGTSWAWISSDPGTLKSQVEIWQAKPLKRVFKAQFERILTANWLFGNGCLILVEHSTLGPRTWIVEGRSWKMNSAMQGCLGVVDNPNRKEKLRLRTQQTFDELEQALLYTHTDYFSQLLKSGVLWTEAETSGGGWERVEPLKAARQWVLTNSGSANDALAAFFPLDIPRRQASYLDHWVQSVVHTDSSDQGEFLGKTCHSLLVKGKLVQSLWTRNATNGGPRARLSSNGELLLSGASFHDLNSRVSTDLKADLSMFAVRLSNRERRQWTINLPKGYGDGLLLWSDKRRN